MKTLLAVLLLAHTGCSTRSPHIVRSNHEVTIDDLLQLPGWPADEGASLSEREWAQLLNVARRAQRSSDEHLLNTLGEFDGLVGIREGGPCESEGGVFLMLRLMFRLPECAPRSEREMFVGWTHWPQDAIVNIGWPIVWRNRRPQLVDTCGGAMSLYYSSMEFEHFRERYPYRDLEDVSLIDTRDLCP